MYRRILFRFHSHSIPLLLIINIVMLESDPAGFPWPSAPPDGIYENSTNIEVQLYVYYRLLQIQETLTKQDAWNIARSIIGDGHAILRFKEQDWTEQIGGPRGRIINREIEESKYVHVNC